MLNNNTTKCGYYTSITTQIRKLNATKYKECGFDTVYVWTVYIYFLLNMFGVYLNLFR